MSWRLAAVNAAHSLATAATEAARAAANALAVGADPSAAATPTPPADTGAIGTAVSTGPPGSNATELDKTLQKVNPITQIMLAFVTAFTKTQSFFENYAMGLIGILATIDLTWTTLSNIENGDHLQETMKKVVKYCFFVWLITNYTTVLIKIMQGFVWIGWKAGCLGNNPVLTIKQVINPEAIFYSGANKYTGDGSSCCDTEQFRKRKKLNTLNIVREGVRPKEARMWGWY